MPTRCGPWAPWALGCFFNGTDWRTVSTPVVSGENVDDVHGVGDSGPVIAVGDQGTLLRWTQGAWAPTNTHTNAGLHSAFVINEATAGWPVATAPSSTAPGFPSAVPERGRAARCASGPRRQPVTQSRSGRERVS